MPLNRRQEVFYTFTADLFAPLDPTVDSDQAGQDMQYPPIPTHQAVRCYHEETDETANPSIVGRNRLAIIFTTDKFRFAADQDVGDGWLIRLWNPPEIAQIGDPYQFYIVQGGTQDKPNQGRRTPNFRKVYAIKTTRPRTIDGAGLLIARPAETIPYAQ